MDKIIINEIINKITDSISTNLEDKPRFEDDSYNCFSISKNNFHKINLMKKENRIAFVDGGCQEIIGAPNFSLQFIRTYYNIFENNKIVKSKKFEFFVLIRAINKDGIKYEVVFFDCVFFKEPLLFDSCDETISEGKQRVKISKIGGLIMCFCELKTACLLVEELDKDDVVILDGDLKANYTNESSYLDELYKKGVEKEVVIAGLSKTSNLLTDNGNVLASLLNCIGPNYEWYYYPVAKVNHRNHCAEIYFVKLNLKSRYVFKLEVCNKAGYNIDVLLSLLLFNSKDPTFIGYPYGLFEADNKVRVTNSEKKYLKMRFLANMNVIRPYLNSINAHEQLDSYSF